MVIRSAGSGLPGAVAGAEQHASMGCSDQRGHAGLVQSVSCLHDSGIRDVGDLVDRYGGVEIEQSWWQSYKNLARL